MPEWVRDARPLFTTLSANRPWTRVAVERRVAEAVDDGCDTVMAFVQDEGCALWPSRVAPISPRIGGGDLVRHWAEVTHEAGLRFVAQWMGVHVQTVTAARHPGWLQRDATAAPSTVLCLQSAFGANLIAQVREVVSGYPVDGVYLDGVYARTGGCFCDACRGAFETLFERPMPAPLSAAHDLTGTGHWLDRWGAGGSEDPDLGRFRSDIVTGFLSRLRRTLDAARPGTALIVDTLGVTGAWANGQDLRRLSRVVDAWALECYPDQVHEPLWHAAFASALVAAESPAPVWSLRWISRDPDGDLVSVPPATLQAHTATAIAHGTLPTIVEMDLYAYDDSLRPAVRRVLADAARAHAWQADLRPAGRVGVLAHRPDIQRAEARGAARRAWDPLAGAWLALTEAHLPVRIVSEEDLPDRLMDLATLVIPDVRDLDATEVDAIESAVRAGLGLVLTGRAIAGALGERLGIAVEGAGHRAGTIGPESAGGGELVNFIRFGSHPVVAAMEGRLASYPGFHLRASFPGDGLGWILDADQGAMDGERWFGWLPGESAWPLGAAFQVGAGRVVAWAGPLDRIFFRQGRPEAGASLDSSVRWAAPREPWPQVEAPPTVEVRAWAGEEGVLLTFANRTTNDLYAIGPGVTIDAATSSMAGAGTGGGTMRAQHPRVIVPVAGVMVAIPWSDPMPSIETLSGASPSIRLDAGRLVLGLERLDAYEAVRLVPTAPPSR